MMVQVAAICPTLKEMRVDWYQFYSPDSSSSEDWLLSLLFMSNLCSHFSDIDQIQVIHIASAWRICC